MSGVAYSYFVANLYGSETNTTITVEAGTMDITYNGGPNITASNFGPSSEPFATKTFSLTGTSTLDSDNLGYKVSLIIDENTFSAGAISYTLNSYNTDKNGDVVEPILENQTITTSNIILGNGYFLGVIDGLSHDYELNLYFLDNGENQTTDMEKSFEAHIHVEKYNPCATGNCLRNNILGAKKSNVTEALTYPGRQISLYNEAVLAPATDDYGTSYYFRGAVENNYIVFANMCWRIVRVTGNGHIKLALYNYNPTEAVNPCLDAEDVDDSVYARYDGSTFTTVFNENTMENANVGFMYGTLNSETYAEEHANINKSMVLQNLELWYQNKLSTYSNYLADTIWCNDKSIETLHPYGTILGYGKNQTGYAAFGRLSDWYVEEVNPSLICPNDALGGKLSQFTVYDTVYGNGALTYKIGLLTADELAFAGAMREINNDYYLKENITEDYWTLTPNNCDGVESYMYSGRIGGNINIEEVDDDHLALRPSIALKFTTQVTGNGTSTDPYRVILN